MDKTTFIKEAKEGLDFAVECLNTDVPHNEIDLMVRKLNKLVSLLGYVSQVYYTTEKLYKEQLVVAYHQLVEENRPASTVFNKVLEASVGDIGSLYNYADKVLSSIKVAIDGLRTIISLYKTESETTLKNG